MNATILPDGNGRFEVWANGIVQQGGFADKVEAYYWAIGQGFQVSN